MKYILFAITLILLSACGNKEYETFTNTKYKFQIDYPINWDTTLLDKRMEFMAVQNLVDSVDIYQEGISISVHDNQGIALQEIVDQNIEMTNYYFNNPKIDQEIITINSTEAIQLKVNYQVEGFKLINQATFINHNGKLFTITQISEEEKTDEYAELFKTVLNSFTWLE